MSAVTDVLAINDLYVIKLPCLGSDKRYDLQLHYVEPTSAEVQSGGEGKSTCLNCNSVMCKHKPLHTK
jgi:hypothetical protein